MKKEEVINYCREKIKCGSRDDKNKPRKVGVELKFPVIDKLCNAASADKVQLLWEYLESMDNWEPIIDEQTGVKYGVKRKAKFSAETPLAGVSFKQDYIRSETGCCKLEFSLHPAEDLFEIERNLQNIKENLKSFCSSEDLHFLGYGIQPQTEPSSNLLVRNKRHLFWDKIFLPAQGEEVCKVSLFTITAENQCHIDLEEKEMIDACNVFNALAGFQIALSANSPVWRGKIDKRYKAVREIFWDWWMPAKKRVGVPPEKFKDLEDYFLKILSFRPVYVVREKKGLCLLKYKSFWEYLQKDVAEAETPEGEKIKVYPKLTDIDLYFSFFWYNARISRYATLENRANGQQPPQDLLSIPALSLGIMENLESAKRMIDEYPWEEYRTQRVSAIKDGMDAKFQGKPIIPLLEKMLKIAEEGLKERGRGEQVYLKPWWDRLHKKSCPADEIISYFPKEGIRGIKERLVWI